jgi:hypothetical protein
VEIKVDDYIVITISSDDNAAEECFLEKAGRGDNGDWCYAAMLPCCTTKLSKPTENDTSNKEECYSFYLINAKYWKCDEDGHDHKCTCENKNPHGKIKALLQKIDNCTKEIIIWTHNTDNINCKIIKKLFHNATRTSCDSFSHKSPDHAVETFMFNVCQNGQDNFEQEFKKLIEYSLNKKSNSYLISLSIFLPLDIDMQALEITENKETYVENMLTDLEVLNNSKEYKGKNKENEHYRTKLYTLWYLLGEEQYKEKVLLEPTELTPIPKGNQTDYLRKLTGLDSVDLKNSPIYKFLESLDTAVKYEDIKSDCLNTFFSEHEKEEDINTFSKWYRALADELKKLMKS